jgi:hypothetical protein
MSSCQHPGCHGLHDALQGGQDMKFFWASASLCGVCGGRGYVCTLGCVVRKAMYSRAQLSRHNFKNHLSSVEEPHCFGETSHMEAHQPPCSPVGCKSSASLQHFMCTSTSQGMLTAIRKLVCEACFASTTLSMDVIQSVPLHDTYMVLLIARLVFRIGSVHQVLLSSLLSVMVHARPQSGPSSLPINRSQMVRTISNLTNSTSIAVAIPTPHPVELGNCHAYIPLQDLIVHALGMQPASSIILEKYQRLVGSPKGRSCLWSAQKAFEAGPLTVLMRYVCFLMFWFDGWDPNSSLCKANKTPIWTGTVTLIFATLEGLVVFVTTRIITSGPGKADHTEVIQEIVDNVASLQELCNSHKFWTRANTAYALVYPVVLLVTCDQPERRTISGLLAGNSKLHACFGISCNTALLFTSLEACGRCVSQLNTYIRNGRFQHAFCTTCTVCHQWILPSTLGDQAYRYRHPLEPGFPRDAVAGASLNTHAGMVTSSMLIHAWDEAFQNWIVLGTWTQKQVEVYFKVLTINDATTTGFVDQSRRYLLAREYLSNENIIQHPELRRELEERLKSHPADYVKPLHPPMWSLVEMDQLPEAIMHLAMGVVKSVAKFIHQWAAARNKSPYLAERLNFCITMHSRYCRIGRCPMAKYSPLGKFPGWVADTFRTWWIWMPWFYSTLDNNKFAYVTYFLPPTTPAQWTGAECKAFLKSRGHPGYTKLKASESKSIVRTMSHLPNWPPPELIPPACGVSSDQIQVMVGHCHSLFKYLFSEPHCKADAHAAAGHAKLLLTTLTALHRIMNPGDDVPNIYEVKYNFISLPRAVSLLAVFGSARNIQEGGIDGEGVVKLLRPLTPRGLKQHFARNLLDAYHRDQQLQELCDDVGVHMAMQNECTSQERDHLQRLAEMAEADLDASESMADPLLLDEELRDEEFVMDTQQYKTYKTVALLKEYLDLGLPLSFVVAQVEAEPTMGFVIGSGSAGYLLTLEVGTMTVTQPWGFPYFQISIHDFDDNPILLYSRSAEGTRIQHTSFLNYGHLLPHLASVEAGRSVPYAVVTTDAYHMNEKYDFV